MNLRFAPEARQDLLDGYWFYENQEAGVGDYFRRSVSADIQSLKLYGGIHPIIHGCHRAVCRTFPYSIYYRKPDADTVEVIAVLHQRGDPQASVRRLKS